MNVRRFHKIIGIVLLIPFFAWAITGLVFFVKPGYEGAYEFLRPRTYPLDSTIAITPDTSWLEFRYFRTVLGDHLIARTAEGWLHLDPKSLKPRSAPTVEEVKLLVTDAFSANPRRYGRITGVSGDTITTDAGIEITMDWSSLSLQQRGKDTDRIDLLYKIHYLQWTGVPNIDKVLGFVGIVLVMVLALFGVRLAIKRN